MKTNLTSKAHEITAEFFAGNPPIFAVDATVGNGWDTLFLSRLVGGGAVFGFDIQKEALGRAGELLEKNAQSGNVVLFLDGHENMQKRIPQEACGKINCVYFNLGWLPKSDKTTVTKAETTAAALSSSLDIIDKSNGLLSVLCYRGHEGGAEEYGRVLRFFSERFGANFEKYLDEQNDVSPVLMVAKFSNKNKLQKSV